MSKRQQAPAEKEERAAQTRIVCGAARSVAGYQGITNLCKPDDMGGTKLVAPNPFFFDTSVPRTCFQINGPCEQENFHRPGSAQILQAGWKSINWQAMLDVRR